MAIRTLKALIRAMGVAAGVPGQSVTAYVPDFTPGTRATDYILYGWQNWASSDYGYDPISQSIVFPSGTILHFTWDFVCGSHFMQIALPLADWEVGVEGFDPPGTAVLQSVAYGAAGNGTGNALAVKLTGRSVGPNGAQIGKNWFQDYDQGEPPVDNSDQVWEIDIGSTYPSVVGQYDSFTFDLGYPADFGNFNDGLVQSYPVSVGRTVGFVPVNFEWHDSPAYDSLVSTDPVITFISSLSGTHSGSFWVRWQENGTGPWTNFGQVDWSDPRIH